MTKAEWLDIGYKSNVIDLESFEEIAFADAYKEWFLMKSKFIKCQSVDRIEVTYNKYYGATPFVKKNISAITDSDIIGFLQSCLFKFGSITYKELGRIMQIVKGVLVYMRDINKGGSSLHDWEKIKRNLPLDKLESGYKYESALKKSDIEKILDCVINYKIYPTKQNACLLLCMNFFMGLRIGELASLTWNDFDFEKNIVKIYKTESKFYVRDENGEKVGTMVYRVVDDTKTVYSVREVPILPEVKLIYNLIKKNHIENGYDSQYLGYDGTETILIRSLDRTLRKLCVLCDVEYFNSHEIRKTFATVLHFAGVPTRTISDILGHSEIGTTENNYILSYNDNYNEVYKEMKRSLKYNIAIKNTN